MARAHLSRLMHIQIRPVMAAVPPLALPCIILDITYHHLDHTYHQPPDDEDLFFQNFLFVQNQIFRLQGTS